MTTAKQPGSKPTVDLNRLAKEVMKLLKAELHSEAERLGRTGLAGGKK
jgi:hypothetical protein